jgi:hypothetical protein
MNKKFAVINYDAFPLFSSRWAHFCLIRVLLQLLFYIFYTNRLPLGNTTLTLGIVDELLHWANFFILFGKYKNLESEFRKFMEI